MKYNSTPKQEHRSPRGQQSIARYNFVVRKIKVYLNFKSHEEISIQRQKPILINQVKGVTKFPHEGQSLLRQSQTRTMTFKERYSLH